MFLYVCVLFIVFFFYFFFSFFVMQDLENPYYKLDFTLTDIASITQSMPLTRLKKKGFQVLPLLSVVSSLRWVSVCVFFNIVFYLLVIGKQQAPFPGIELPSTNVNSLWLSDHSGDHPIVVPQCVHVSNEDSQHLFRSLLKHFLSALHIRQC